MDKKFVYVIVGLLAFSCLLGMGGALLFGCPPNSIEYNGNCYRNFVAADDPARSVKPSDEKPPTDKIPSYERQGIKADPGIRAVDSTTTAHDYQAEENQR